MTKAQRKDFKNFIIQMSAYKASFSKCEPITISPSLPLGFRERIFLKGMGLGPKRRVSNRIPYVRSRHYR